MLHIKYTDTECICGHFHSAGRQAEIDNNSLWRQDVRYRDMRVTRQELSRSGAAVNETAAEILSPKPDTSIVYGNIDCMDCMVGLDAMLQIGKIVSITEAGLINMKTPPAEPEYRSIEDFVAFLKDNDQTTYSHEDMGIIRGYLEMSVADFQWNLKGHGFTLGTRAKPKHVRGLNSSPYSVNPTWEP